MNFFEAQERARIASRRLVLWFSLAVAGVIASLHAVAVIIKSWLATDSLLHESGIRWLDPQLASTIAPVTGGLILLGSAFKLTQLSAGGAVVARDLGGRAVDPSTTDPLERRFLNVIDEMSIASGIPVPGAWILDGEDGINAFAAGTDPANAVIGITRGSLERLNRDELQGVVAHEFSHILNGDMKLNMRLTGWIFGLVMIAMIGRVLLRMPRHIRVSGDGSKAGGVVLVMLAAGVAVWLAGSLGALFARLLQAAVSRQREYLADASAVQFTRNPQGIANALKKIGGFAPHGIIHSPGAAEARHLFFTHSDFLRLGMATHPPLVSRIRALEPDWNGGWLEADTETAPDPRDSPAPARQDAGHRLVPASASFQPEMLAESRRVDWRTGRAIHSDLERADAGFQSKDEAKAALCGLLLAQDGDGRKRALEALATAAGQAAANLAANHSRHLSSLSAMEKIALIDLSLPWLRRMSPDEAAAFLNLNRSLIEADGEVRLFEFMLERVLDRHVAVGLGLRPLARMRYRSLAELHTESAVLLSAFAGQAGDPAALEAAAAGYQHHTGRVLARVEPAGLNLEHVMAALQRLEMSTPPVKSEILQLCCLVATADGVLRDGEIELMRAAAEAIGAPVPPLSHVGHAE